MNPTITGRGYGANYDIESRLQVLSYANKAQTLKILCQSVSRLVALGTLAFFGGQFTIFTIQVFSSCALFDILM
jgi:hypothetical protein